MPSLADSAFIFVLALLLFGPKKLPELARQLGKLMGEFRRASNEFRMQMEDELRIAEQQEQQKKIAALEAAAPVSPALPATPNIPIPEPDHPHMESAVGTSDYTIDDRSGSASSAPEQPAPQEIALHETTPLPIATSGDLELMPPATGLPVARGASPSHYEAPAESVSLDPMLESIPQTSDPAVSHEATTHG